MASVTLPVNPVAVFPFASRAVTSIAGVMLAPAAVLVGCTVNTSVPALPAVILNAALAPVAGPVAPAGGEQPAPKSGSAPGRVGAPPSAAAVSLHKKTRPAAVFR